MPTERPATWTINDDSECLTLAIELGNDHAVSLTCWKNNDNPTVVLWTGDGEGSFVKTKIEQGVTLENFRAWIDLAAPGHWIR